MKKLKSWFAAVSCAATIVLAGEVRADHPQNQPLVAISDELRGQIDEMRDALRNQFRHSEVYNELMWKSHEMKGVVSRIRNQARRNECGLELRDELEALECAIEEMFSLAEIARLRAVRGLDRPIIECSISLEARLARMRQSVLAMKRFALGGHWSPYGQVRGYHGPYGRYADRPFEDYRTDRRYTDHRFDDDRSEWYRDGREASSFEIRGPRDRAGLEFGDRGGIVLNIGGASVRVR